MISIVNIVVMVLIEIRMKTKIANDDFALTDVIVNGL